MHNNPLNTKTNPKTSFQKENEKSQNIKDN